MLGSYKVKEQGPAITVRTTVCGDDFVSIDFIACFRCTRKQLPGVRIDWPHNNKWPQAKEQVSKVLDCHLNFVPKKNYTFDISYNEMEKQLSKFADSDDGKRKMCQRLLKSFNEIFWSEDIENPFIASYKLKVKYILSVKVIK